MAVVPYLVSNPNDADVTTNGKTAKANETTQLSFDDAALANGLTDMTVFHNAGCVIMKASITTSQMEEAGYQLAQGHGAVPGH